MMMYFHVSHVGYNDLITVAFISAILAEVRFVSVSADTMVSLLLVGAVMGVIALGCARVLLGLRYGLLLHLHCGLACLSSTIAYCLYPSSTPSSKK